MSMLNGKRKRSSYLSLETDGELAVRIGLSIGPWNGSETSRALDDEAGRRGTCRKLVVRDA